MKIYFTISGTDKSSDKSLGENENFHQKLYIAYLNEASIESNNFRNQTFGTYALKDNDGPIEIDKIPIILSINDQRLLHDLGTSD